MPANLPASRDIWLRSQLAPCSLMGVESADTRPGRSSPITVRIKLAIDAGYETSAMSRNVHRWRAHQATYPAKLEGRHGMRLEPLYRVRFVYDEGWTVELEGGWEQHLLFAEGRCEGSITGRFRGANYPQRRTDEGPFVPDFRAVIETDDGETILCEWHGYGRAYPPGRRQIVGSVRHLSDSDRYRHLNDVVCVCAGEVRTPADPDQDSPDLVMDVAELVWEPIPD